MTEPEMPSSLALRDATFAKVKKSRKIKKKNQFYLVAVYWKIYLTEEGFPELMACAEASRRSPEHHQAGGHSK